MFDSTFVSCPIIGFQHTLEITTKEYNKVNGSPQYDVLYPNSTRYSLQELVDDLDKAHEIFLEDAKAAFEASYNEYLDADLGDLDAFGEPIDNNDIELANGVIVSVDAVPACGDCGECCECLGEPEDCRFDTTLERDDFYREIG